MCPVSHCSLQSKKEFFGAMKHLASCFDNIFLASKRIKVSWGEMSVLDMELICMKDLFQKYKDWSYVINLTGQVVYNVFH